MHDISTCGFQQVDNLNSRLKFTDSPAMKEIGGCCQDPQHDNYCADNLLQTQKNNCLVLSCSDAGHETFNKQERARSASPVTITGRHNNPLRRSSLTHKRAATYMVKDLYRSRTVAKLVSESKLLSKAQSRLLYEIPSFIPSDFGLEFCSRTRIKQTVADEGLKDPIFIDGNQKIGKFSNPFSIYGVESFTMKRNNTSNVIDCISKFNSQTHPQNVQKYALKKVNHCLLHADAISLKPKAIPQAAIALALEAHFLASVSHPNILSIRGIADPNLTPLGQMFFVVDQLHETLEQRITRKWIPNWKKYECINDGFLTDMFGTTSSQSKQSQHQKEALEFHLERHNAARELASALEHLHENRIVHRDIKPANIGFLMPSQVNSDNTNAHESRYHNSGRLQLFDFGIASELPSSTMFRENKRSKINGDVSSHVKDETFLLTPCVGTIRYMAPEVYLGRNYGTAADVYSMGIVFYQMFSLSTPYKGMTEKCMKSCVFQGGMRPGMEIQRYWYKDLRDLIPECWSQSLFRRPGAQEVAARLNLMVAQAENAIKSLEPKDSHNTEPFEIEDSQQRRGSLKDTIKKVIGRRMSLDKGLHKTTKRRHSIGGWIFEMENKPLKNETYNPNRRRSMGQTLITSAVQNLTASLERSNCTNSPEYRKRAQRRCSATKYSPGMESLF